MIKYVLLFLQLFAMLVYKMFLPEEASVRMHLPSAIKAGSEFLVELTVNRADGQGFARLQQDLPEGLTAFPVETSGADFTFSDRSVNYTWATLPQEQEFKISYKVIVDNKVSGIKRFGGNFFYIENNSKQSVALPSSSLTITNAPLLASLLSNTGSYVSNADSVQPQTPVTGMRQVPSEATDNFIVEVTLNKGDLSGFAKLQETLPEGLTATAMETNKSSFTFVNQQVKFVWITLPAEAEFKVSYRVSVAPGISGQKDIEGVFSYLENDETQKYIITKSSVKVNNGAPEPVSTNETQTSQTNTTQAEPAELKKSTATASSTPAPQAGVNYRVQICAIHRTIPTSYFEAAYNISETIYTDPHEGWIKYTVGGFNEYKLARDHREGIGKKGVAGPFVTAYNNGKRITVQEALMITKQQWYK